MSHIITKNTKRIGRIIVTFDKLILTYLFTNLHYPVCCRSASDELANESLALYAGIPVTGLVLLVILVLVVILLRRQNTWTSGGTFSCSQGGRKSKPLLIYQHIVLKPSDKATFLLTLSLPIPLRLYTLPYWSNPPFLIFDIRALWRHSARMSKIKNGGLDQYGAGPFEQRQFRTAGAQGVKVDCWTSHWGKCEQAPVGIKYSTD